MRELHGVRISNVLITCLWALTVSIVTACGGGDEGGGPTGQIVIETPATGFSTNATSVTVSGRANMANLVDPLSDEAITWSASGNSGVASRSIFASFPFGFPVYSWDATVPLVFGDNTISVSFLGDSQSIIVTRFTQVNVVGAVTLATTAAAVPGVLVSLALSPSSGGGNRLETADENGTYKFVWVRAGNYTVSPEAPPPPQSSICFSYDPPNTAINIGDTDTADKQVDFIATPQSPCYSISGRVVASTDPTFGMRDVTVRLTDSSGNALARVTNTAGIYTFYQLPPGSYTVTPSASFAQFNPASRTATITNTSIFLPDIARLF